MSLLKEQRLFKKLRQSAKGEICVMCGSCDGTVVLAHRNMSGDFGMGLKGYDWWGAYLCAECHFYSDNDGRRDYQFWELAVYRTMKCFIAKGLVKIGG